MTDVLRKSNMLGLFFGIFLISLGVCFVPAIENTVSKIIPIEAKATDFLDGIKIEGTGDEAKLNPGKVATEEGNMDFNQVLGKYKYIVMAFTGVLTITMFGAMVYMFMKLGASGDNETMRRKAIGGILTTGIATALLGSATIIIGFFYSALGKV